MVFPCHSPHRFHVAEITLGPKILQAARMEYVVTASVVCSRSSPMVEETKTRDFQRQNPRRMKAPVNANGAHQARHPQSSAAK